MEEQLAGLDVVIIASFLLAFKAILIEGSEVAILSLATIKQIGRRNVFLGVALGSLTWMSVLASGISLARRAIGPRAMRFLDAAAAAGLLGFGGALAYGTVREH